MNNFKINCIFILVDIHNIPYITMNNLSEEVKGMILQKADIESILINNSTTQKMYINGEWVLSLSNVNLKVEPLGFFEGN